MNKYLFLSAAAALTAAAACTANAGSYSVHYGTSSGASLCDGLLVDNIGKEFVGHHIYTTCGYSYNVAVLGFAEKQKGDPVGAKHVMFSDATGAFLYGTENYAFLWDIQNPIKAGNKWAVWVYFATGSTSFLPFNKGILLPGQYAKHRAGQKSRSTISRLIEALNVKPVVVAK